MCSTLGFNFVRKSDILLTHCYIRCKGLVLYSYDKTNKMSVNPLELTPSLVTYLECNNGLPFYSNFIHLDCKNIDFCAQLTF